MEKPSQIRLIFHLGDPGEIQILGETGNLEKNL
jgi:hypothetical protein